MKKIIFTTLTIGAAIVFWYGCEEKEDELPGTIYGVITDKATGEPVRAAGVQLSPTGTKTVTGNEGQYEFSELKAGEYSISVTKTGYADLNNYNINVAAGKTNKGDVQIEKLPASLRVVNDNKEDVDALDFGGIASDITRSFAIFNDGQEALEWEITKTSEWITAISKTNGTLKAGATQSVIVTIDRAKLSAGENTTNVHITSDNGSRQLVVTAQKPMPVLNTSATTNITATTAQFNGVVVNAGNPSYIERGFVYATSSMPTIENTIAKLTVAVTATQNYQTTATNLVLGQTYYVRAYAINSVGTSYSSNEASFTTQKVLPQVTTSACTNIDATIATLNGNIISVGDPAYTERGFVYATYSNPAIEDGTIKTVNGSSTGTFTTSLSNLTEGRTYYVRAYATNSEGTAYGAQISFTPKSPHYTLLSSAGIAVQNKDISLYEINWTNANNACNNSTVGEYNNWRLPTLDELTAIYNNQPFRGGMIPGIINEKKYSDPHAFDGYLYDCPWYWSSTSAGTSKHITLRMTNGDTSGDYDYETSIEKTIGGLTAAYYIHYARCVRTLP